MNKYTLALALFSLFSGTFSSAQSSAAPTWSLHCTAYPQANAGPELLLGIDRLPPGDVAKATFSLVSSFSSLPSEFQSMTMTGSIEDGHDHLVVHLNSTHAQTENWAKMTVDLSYESSISTLQMENGTEYQFTCATTQF